MKQPRGKFNDSGHALGLSEGTVRVRQSLQAPVRSPPNMEEIMDRSEIGRALSAMRRTDIESKCHRCGKPITGTTKSRWCSAACCQAAYRERKAEAELDKDLSATTYTNSG